MQGQRRVGIYGPVDVGKSALIHQLIDKKYIDSIQKKQEITVFVSCNDVLYHGNTVEQIRRYNPQTDEPNDAWRLVAVDTPGHTKIICNSLSTLPFVNTPILLLDNSSFDIDIPLKYLDIIQSYGFTRIIIVLSKIDKLNLKSVLELHVRIEKIMKNYTLEYTICDYSIYSQKAKLNLLSLIYDFPRQQSALVKWVKGYAVIMKSFDGNKPGELVLKEDHILFRNNDLFKGGLIGVINYGIQLKLMNSFYIGPLYLDLYSQTIKKEKITCMKPLILGTFKNSLLTTQILEGETGTIELSCSPGVTAGDGLAGGIVSTDEISSEFELVLKTNKVYHVLSTKDKVLINLLNLKLIGSVQSIEKKGIIRIKLTKPLPLKYGGAVVVHKNKQTSGSSSRLQIYALATVVV